MAPDHSDGALGQEGREIQVERPHVFASRGGRRASQEGFVPVSPASVQEARAGIDWSLLALLLAGERRAPIVLLGDDLEALALGLASMGDPIIPVERQLDGVGRPVAPQAGAITSPVCGGISGGLPLRDASAGAIILNQVIARPPDGPDEEPMSIRPGLLAEAYRVLRPGGILCLVVSQRRHRLRLAALQAWLEQCGFGRSHVYLALPGHRRFTALTPLASGRTMRSCVDLLFQGNASRERCLRLWLKTLATLGLLESRMAEYVVLGRKER